MQQSPTEEFPDFTYENPSEMLEEMPHGTTQPWLKRSKMH